MESFEIDLDSECVWLDDAWLNREDLVRKIRSMMDSQNFEIARPSQALEALTKSLANARLLALRISPEMSDALNAASQATNRPVGAVAREAIASWLASAPSAAANASASAASNLATTQPSAVSPVPAAASSSTSMPAPILAAATAAADPSSTVITSMPGAVTSEPVSAEEAANAVALTPKRKEGEQPQEVEKRWFGK